MKMVMAVAITTKQTNIQTNKAKTTTEQKSYG